MAVSHADDQRVKLLHQGASLHEVFPLYGASLLHSVHYGGLI